MGLVAVGARQGRRERPSADARHLGRAGIGPDLHEMLGIDHSIVKYAVQHTAYRPVMDAIDLLVRYASVSSDERLYPAEELVPIEGVVPKTWTEAITDTASGRIERIPYARMRTCRATSTTTTTCTTPLWPSPWRAD